MVKKGMRSLQERKVERAICAEGDHSLEVQNPDVEIL